MDGNSQLAEGGPLRATMEDEAARAEKLEFILVAEHRFWSKVSKDGPDGCWPWRGAHSSYGYGNFRVRKHPPLYQSAHRVAWTLSHGILPPADACVLHACDNPPCCNPAHLWLGSHADNAHDKQRKGRGRVGIGERHGNCKLSAADIDAIRRRSASGESYSAIARGFSISPQHARCVVLGIWRRGS